MRQPTVYSAMVQLFLAFCRPVGESLHNSCADAALKNSPFLGKGAGIDRKANSFHILWTAAIALAYAHSADGVSLLP